MTPTPIKRMTVYVKSEKVLTHTKVVNGAFFTEQTTNGVEELPDRYVFSKQELEAHDKETLRGFIDKYGEMIFGAGWNRGKHLYSSVEERGDVLPPAMGVFLSSLKAELGINDNTTEK